jgi:hypothetical protein
MTAVLSLRRVAARLRVSGLVIGSLLACGAAGGFSALLAAQAGSPPAPSDDYRKRFARVEDENSVHGAQNCQACHSGRVRRATDRTKRDEYELWYASGTGAHSRAYETLNPGSSAQSRHMGALLDAADGGGADPRQRRDCLACHALPAPEERQITTYNIEEGVSCEACHGRSTAWQGPHQVWSTWHAKPEAEWLEMGMYDTRNVLRTAQKCLECHMGSAGREVTHTMMGAGHPDLTLELVSDMEHVPAHWVFGNSTLWPDEGQWHFARVWAVGQAVALYESMQRVLRWADDESQPTPDFALFDCFACHHEFLNTPSRDPGRPRLPGVALGEPPWNAAPWAACRSLVQVLAPEDRSAADAAAEKLLRSLRVTRPDRAAVKQSAAQLAQIADRLAARAYRQRFDRDLTRRLLREVASDHAFHIAVGPRGAEQGFGALNALYRRAWGETDARPEFHVELVKIIDELEKAMFTPKGRERDGASKMEEPDGLPQLDARPFEFDPARYRAAMERVHTLLGE